MTQQYDRRQVLVGGALVSAATLLPASASADTPAPRTDSLWYPRPADEWVQALPIGNGRIGAMVFGGIAAERLQLNEDSFFSGGPYDPTNPDARAALPEVRRLVFAGQYADAEKLINAKLMSKPLEQMSYQTIGDLLLTFPGIENASGYIRELHLPTAIARTRFETNGTNVVREVFASAPDQVLVLRLATGTTRRITVNVTLATPQKAAIGVEDGNTIVMSGTGPADKGIAGAVKFEARARVIATGGTVRASDDGVYVLNADEVVILVSMATNVRSYEDLTADPAALNRTRLEAAARLGYATLLARHIADFRPLFERVTLDLGSSEEAWKATDERIRGFAMSRDPALAALYFQYGRYLLLSSSRRGSQPANLQGIWNERTNPPWGSKWTININAQMNYWPAGPANLLECVEPLVRLTKDLSVTGAKVAREMYGARGWVAHHNTDLWRAAAPIDGARWGMWQMGGAWLTSSLWDFWEYSRDRALLAEIYPLLRGAAEFFIDTLQEDPREHLLVTNPSVSPENTHPKGSTICAGPAMDSQLLRDLFAHAIEAATLLGVDAQFREEATRVRGRLPQDRIGKAGQLQEWMDDWDMDAPEINHRHISHMFALHPSEQITLEDTPELAAAAKRSLQIRGDESTGWGIAWRLNLWTRLADGNHAHDLLKLLLSPQRTYPNLFDAHPPFQIDGNFGATAAIAEMLVQSHRRRLKLLAALPNGWRQGRVTGLRARGGFEVDVAWSGGKLERVSVLSLAGEETTLVYGTFKLPLKLARGARTAFEWRGDKLVKA